jgi:signal transduction histidine kinase
MVVDVFAESFVDDLPEEHRTCVFRVAQEALRNAIRHSGGRVIRIYLREDQRTLHLSVQDDGRGFDPTQDKGLGILGMHERVTRLSGKVELSSHSSRGTVIDVYLPLPPDPRPGESISSEGDLQEISPFRTA